MAEIAVPAGAPEATGGHRRRGRSLAAVDRPPPHVFFLISAVCHYLGPAFAVLLFVRVDVLGVAWLRIVSAAVIFAVWRRPWRAFLAQDRSGRRLLLACCPSRLVATVCRFASSRPAGADPWYRVYITRSRAPAAAVGARHRGQAARARRARPRIRRSGRRRARGHAPSCRRPVRGLAGHAPRAPLGMSMS
jgi:hypothetical protein